MGYPAPQDERQILVNLQRDHPINNLQPLSTTDSDLKTGLSIIQQLQKKVWEMFVEESLQNYMIDLVGATRQHPDLALGASPRASLALFKTAQALAAVRGRDFVIPDDIKYLVHYVVPHRLIVRPEAELRGRTPEKILQEVIEATDLDISSNA
jgi:MoxR-like ATPase